MFVLLFNTSEIHVRTCVHVSIHRTVVLTPKFYHSTYRNRKHVLYSREYRTYHYYRFLRIACTLSEKPLIFGTFGGIKSRFSPISYVDDHLQHYHHNYNIPTIITAKTTTTATHPRRFVNVVASSSPPALRRRRRRRFLWYVTFLFYTYTVLNISLVGEH